MKQSYFNTLSSQTEREYSL